MDALGQKQFDAYCCACNKDKQPVTFAGFLAEHGAQADIGESNTTSAASLASGLIHGAYRAANILFMVKLVSLTAASTLLGPAAPIFLGVFAAYAVGNALYGFFKEGREQAELHHKRVKLYDTLFPGARKLFEAQQRLQQQIRQLDKTIAQQQTCRHQQDQEALNKLKTQQQAIKERLAGTTSELKAQKTAYQARGIELTPPPEPPQTAAHSFYQFCATSAAWFSNTVGTAFAAVETTVNTVKNGCKLGACVAGLGLTMMAMEHPVAQIAGLVTTVVGLAIGAVGLFCGLFTTNQQHQKNTQRQTTIASAQQDNTAATQDIDTKLRGQPVTPASHPADNHPVSSLPVLTNTQKPLEVDHGLAYCA